jgi:hypothetical protein
MRRRDAEVRIERRAFECLRVCYAFATFEQPCPDAVDVPVGITLCSGEA